MVSRPSDKSKTIVDTIICLVFAFCLFVNAATFFATNVETNPKAQITTKKYKFLDFQPLVNSWANSVGGEKSILIYDLDLGKIAASYNATKIYNVASLYKLFVVYEGYRRYERGEWGDDKLRCLDLAIRESNSPCAESLWSAIGPQTLQNIANDELDLKNTNISNIASNAEDITKIMELYYRHPDFSESTVAKIKDSMLNQPITTYNWRQGLPSGFSSRTKVYDKVGWDMGYKTWNVYHDTAIIEFPEIDRHFIVTVLTKKIDHQRIAEFGTRIEKFVLGE